MTTVINLWDLEGKPWPEGAVYIGRAQRGRAETKRSSVFANPFVIVEGRNTRAEVIRKYEEYIREKSELVERAKKELKGKTLVCWCKPLDCHGDVLVRIVEES